MADNNDLTIDLDQHPAGLVININGGPVDLHHNVPAGIDIVDGSWHHVGLYDLNGRHGQHDRRTFVEYVRSCPFVVVVHGAKPGTVDVYRRC